jgi:hypothetical protein
MTAFKLQNYKITQLLNDFGRSHFRGCAVRFQALSGVRKSNLPHWKPWLADGEI